MDIEVTDWPLAELDRFKAKRPHIYAQMKTRLMTVTPQEPGPPRAQDCARLKALKAEGKVQQLPPAAPAAGNGAQGGRSCQAGRQFVSPQGTAALLQEHIDRHGLPTPCACRDMTEVRAEIDRVDKALVDPIAERFGYVERAWQLKLEARQEANVPWRNQQVFDKVRARAVEKGAAAGPVEALWRQMIGWFIQYEEEKLRAQARGQVARLSVAGGHRS